jgi:hypothetical protein
MAYQPVRHDVFVVRVAGDTPSLEVERRSIDKYTHIHLPPPRDPTPLVAANDQSDVDI